MIRHNFTRQKHKESLVRVDLKKQIRTKPKMWIIQLPDIWYKNLLLTEYPVNRILIAERVQYWPAARFSGFRINLVGW